MRRGFSLVEVLVVLAILAILTIIIGGVVSKNFAGSSHFSGYVTKKNSVLERNAKTNTQERVQKITVQIGDDYEEEYEASAVFNKVHVGKTYKFGVNTYDNSSVTSAEEQR